METERLVAWRLRQKGRGLRWIILREIVLVLAHHAMNTTSLQNVMTVSRGLKHSTVTGMLDELKQSSCVIEEWDKETGYYWTVTQTGISFYLGSREAVPQSEREKFMNIVIGLTTKTLDEFEYLE